MTGLLIEMGIGWKRDPDKPNGLVSADIRDYVAEIERLRAALKTIGDKNCGSGIAARIFRDAVRDVVDTALSSHGDAA